MRDRLSAGERVGEIELLPGQVARLAESPTQPGWDLRIENEDGSVAELIQLKATESMAYVKSALDEYPGIRVAVPSEVDDSTDQVLGTDISNEQLELVTKTQMEELGEGMAEDLLDKGAELAADSIPFVSMITTGVIEGRNLLAGRSTLQESLSRGARRIGKAAVYDAIGTVSGIGPGMIAVRVAESRISGRVALGDRLEALTAELRQLKPIPH